MANQKPKLDWTEIDVTTLSNVATELHSIWKADAKIAAESRGELETVLSQDLFDAGETPAGKEAVFAYRWGKVSFAMGEPTEKSKSNKAFKF